MIKPGKGKAQGKFKTIDIADFMTGKLFKEADFRANLRAHDFSIYEGKRVLIKPCGAGPVPPWSFMLLLGHLTPHEPRMVAYGEDCAPVVVYRNSSVLVEDDEI